MMRVLLHAWGSRGDVQPVLALALRLRDRGHQPAIAAMLDFREWITGQGIEFEPIDADLARLSHAPAGRRYLGGQALSPGEDLRALRDFLTPAAPAIAQTLVRTHQAYEATVTNPITLEATLSLPPLPPGRVACAMLQPGMASADARSTMFAARPGTSQINRLVGVIATIKVRGMVRPVAQATCDRAGRPGLSWRRYIRRTAEVTFMLGVSPVVTPPAADWRLPTTVTGYWQLLPDPAWQPDPALDAFLAQGEPPVYIGFGSMLTEDPQRISRTIRDAVAKANVRAVVLRGIAGLAIDDPRVLLIDGAPHDWLFPRVAAVASHGGAGTTAAALTAGTPQIVIPHLTDQPYWARRIHDLGVGPAPIAPQDLTASTLAQAITDALTHAHRETATTLAEQLRHEQGTETAATALEHSWAKGTAAIAQ